MNNNKQIVIYELDKEKRIVDVGGHWDEFAMANDGMNAVSEKVRGRPIFDFVAGDSTRMWLDVLFQLSTVTAEAVEKNYRCDSPYVQRYMKMKIVYDSSDILRVEHVLERVEPLRVPVLIFNPTAHAETKFSHVKVENRKIYERCSICGRIFCDETWREPEYLAVSEYSFIPVEYVVCPDCDVLEQ